MVMLITCVQYKCSEQCHSTLHLLDQNSCMQLHSGHYIQWTQDQGTRDPGTLIGMHCACMYGILEPRWVTQASVCSMHGPVSLIAWNELQNFRETSKSFFHSSTPALSCGYLPGNTFTDSSSLHRVCIHASSSKSQGSKVMSICSVDNVRLEWRGTKSARTKVPSAVSKIPQSVP